MCNRISMVKDEAIRAQLYIDLNLADAKVRQAYNIPVRAKSGVPVVRTAADNSTQIAVMRWGYVPHYDNNPVPKLDPTNGRSASAFARPIYRLSIQQRRCVVVADGFYEWLDTSTGKQGYYFQTASRTPFYLPGIYERPHGPWPESFLIFTTDPNQLVARFNDRMPVILQAEQARQWIRQGPISAEQFNSQMVQVGPGELVVHPVSRFANSARNDGPECIAPIELPPETPAPTVIQPEFF